MPLIDTVLREKQLRRDRSSQALVNANVRCEETARTASIARDRHAEARALLWDLLNEDGLCVARLGLATAHERVADEAVERAARAHDAAVQRREALRLRVARLEKDIEKLAERRDARRSLRLSERLKQQWRQLDDWVLSRRAGER
jgi:hypothetical protein